MRHPILVLGFLAAAGTVQARDSGPADLAVYMKGDRNPPCNVEMWAKATVAWMYARIGIRLEWHDGDRESARSGGPVTIQVRFVREDQVDAGPEALAYALPFGDGTTAITVMYDRVSRLAGGTIRAQALLAHVLAHEIGHVLKRNDAHAQTGVMKARWCLPDYDAMERRQLEFTSDDVRQMKQGLNRLKADAATLVDRPRLAVHVIHQQVLP